MATTPLGFRIPLADGSEQISELEEWFRNLGTDIDTYLGTGSAWTSYTPTFSGAGSAVGNGTIAGAYARVGKSILFRVSLLFGTTTTMGTGCFMTLPVSASAGQTGSIPSFKITFDDASSGIGYSGDAKWSGAGNMELFSINTAGTYATLVSTNATAPFTWTTSDRIRFGGTYESV